MAIIGSVTTAACAEGMQSNQGTQMASRVILPPVGFCKTIHSQWIQGLLQYPVAIHLVTSGPSMLRELQEREAEG